MSWLDRLLGRRREDDGDDDAPVDDRIVVNVPVRRAQLEVLEQALDALVNAMQQPPCPVENPGWQGRIHDYEWMLGNTMMLRRGALSKEALYDVLLAVRPVFPGEVPDHLAHLIPLQDDVVAAAREIEQPLPGEA